MDTRDQDFVESLGPSFLAHLLRRISDELVDAEKPWYREADLVNPPRTASTLLALDQKGPLSITELATLLRQSHQLVQQWIKELRSCNLVLTSTDPADRRRSLVSLTKKGRREVRRLSDYIMPIETAVVDLLEATNPELYEALWRLERTLRTQPFIDRIRAADRALSHRRK